MATELLSRYASRIFNQRARVVRPHDAHTRVRVACTRALRRGNDRPIAAAASGRDDRAGIDPRICKPAPYRSTSRRLVNRGCRAFTRVISGSRFIGSRARSSRNRAKQWIRHISRLRSYVVSLRRLFAIVTNHTPKIRVYTQTLRRLC